MSRPEVARRKSLTRNGSNYADSRKDITSAGSHDDRPHLVSHIREKPPEERG